MDTAGPRSLQASPYKGLTHYDEEDARFFFGRDRDREIISANLAARRLTLLYGESGVGKSSVLRAGVSHDLRERARRNLEEGLPAQFVPVVFSSWRDDPIRGLLDAVQAAVVDLVGEPQGPPAHEATLEEGLRAWSELAEGELLLVLDQFEEYFLYHADEQGADAFIEAFPRAVNRLDLRVHFLIAIREDALAQLDRFKRRVPRLFESTLRISHLDLEAGREAIQGPIVEYNALRRDGAEQIEIEPELVRAVLQQVQAGRVVLDEQQEASPAPNGGKPRIEAPYLQLVMRRVWDEEMQRGSLLLRLSTLKELGGAGEIVRTHLNGALGSLTATEQEIAAAALRFLVTGSGTKIAYAASDLAEFTGWSPENLQPVLEQLSSHDRRILRPIGRAPVDTGDERYEIFHDVLAPAILDWRRRYGRAELERKREEAERRARRDRHKARLAVAAAGAFLLLATFAALVSVWAIDQKNQAESQRQLARSRALLTAAADQLDKRVDRGILLSLEAYRTRPSAETRSGLIDAVERTGQVSRIVAAKGTATRVVPDDQGRRIALIGTDRVTTWDGRRGVHTTEAVGGAESAAFSRDGTVLAVGATGSVLRWDLLHGRQLATLRLPARSARYAVEAVAFSPADRRVAAVTADGHIAAWENASGRALPSPRLNLGLVGAVGSAPGSIAVDNGNGNWLTVLSFDRTGDLATRSRRIKTQAPIADVALSANRRFVVALSRSGDLTLWDLSSNRVSHPRAEPSRRDAFSVALDRTGRSIGVGWSDGTVEVWKRNRLRSPHVALGGHHDGVLDLAFRDDGRLVSTSADGSTLLWTPWESAFRRSIATLGGLVTDATVSSDGQELAAASSMSGTFAVWRLEAGRARQLVIDAGPIRRPSAVAFAPQGHELALGDDNGVVVLARGDGGDAKVLARGRRQDGVTALTFDGSGLLAWSTSSGRVLFRDPAHSRSLAPLNLKGARLQDLVLSSNGSLLAVASRHGTSLWEVSSQKRVSPDPVKGHWVRGVAFDGQTRTLASALDGGGVVLWDIAAGRQLGTLSTGSDRVNAVAFSPDGATLAAAGDGHLFLWDTATLQPLGRPLSGANSPLSTVAFSPNRRELATGALDGLSLWRDLLWADVTGMQRRLCAVVGRNLEAADWHAFLPWERYRRSCPRWPAGG